MYTCEIFSCKQALVPARAIDILHPKSMELCSQEQKELWKTMHMEKTTEKTLALLDKMSTKLSTSPYYYYIKNCYKLTIIHTPEPLK